MMFFVSLLVLGGMEFGGLANAQIDLSENRAISGKILYEAVEKGISSQRSIFLSCVDTKVSIQELCKSFVFIETSGFAKKVLSPSLTHTYSLPIEYFVKDIQSDLLALVPDRSSDGHKALLQLLEVFTSPATSTTYTAKNIEEFDAIRALLSAVIFNYGGVKGEMPTALKNDLSAARTFYGQIGWAGNFALPDRTISLGAQTASSRVPLMTGGLMLQTDGCDHSNVGFLQVKLRADAKSASGSAVFTFAENAVRGGGMFKIDSGYFKNRWAAGLALSMHDKAAQYQFVVFVLPASWGHVYGQEGLVVTNPELLAKYSSKKSYYQPSLGLDGVVKINKKSAIFVDVEAGLIVRNDDAHEGDSSMGSGKYEYNWVDPYYNNYLTPHGTYPLLGPMVSGDMTFVETRTRARGGFVSSNAGYELSLENGWSIRVSHFLQFMQMNQQSEFQYLKDQAVWKETIPISVTLNDPEPVMQNVYRRELTYQEKVSLNQQTNKVIKGFQIHLVKGF